MYNSLKKDLALPISLNVIVIILVAVSTAQLSSMMVSYADTGTNVYAKYSTNNQAQSLTNDCGEDESSATNCGINGQQVLADGTANVATNLEISNPAEEGSEPGPSPEPNQQLQVRQVNADTPTLIQANSSGTSVANCDPTEDVTGGGLIFGEVGDRLSNEINPQYSERESENGWAVEYFNPGPRDVNLLAFAECASLLP